MNDLYAYGGENDADRNFKNLMRLNCFGNTFINSFGFTISKKMHRIGFNEETFYLYGSPDTILQKMRWFGHFDDPNKLYQQEIEYQE